MGILLVEHIKQVYLEAGLLWSWDSIISKESGDMGSPELHAPCRMNNFEKKIEHAHLQIFVACASTSCEEKPKNKLWETLPKFCTLFFF